MWAIRARGLFDARRLPPHHARADNAECRRNRYRNESKLSRAYQVASNHRARVTNDRLPAPTREVSSDAERARRLKQHRLQARSG